MKFRKLCSLITAAALMATAFAGCAESSGGNEVSSSAYQSEITDGDIVSFRPVDCGIQPQSTYEYPFIGMTVKLSDTILEKMESREVFVFSDEDYTDTYAVSYAVLRFSATTKEQREAEGMSIDIFSWEAQLEKIAAIGVFKKDTVSRLDELTACDIHKKIGESPNGEYEYYISTSSKGNAELAAELSKTDISISEMHTLDPNLGYTAFSTDRLQNVNTVGEFSANDIFGKTYTNEFFGNYDLTLVNVFTTWCSPCVEEMPVLEKLRQEYESKNIKLGVLGVVLDVKTASGTDESALERAKLLYERSEAGFPFLIPDDSNMNGRLTGIESFPESFFVDRNGNIVSEPYIGANSQKEWSKIVEQELSGIIGE